MEGSRSLFKRKILRKKTEGGEKMNFKSKKAYMKWLGFVHASGEAKRVKGHQKIKIKGKKHKVKH